MKKIFALPGILLPISILAVYSFIGSSLLDLRVDGSYAHNMFSSNLFYTEFSIPLFISWILHIVLQYIKPSFQKWAWLQVAVSIISLFILYFLVSFYIPGNGLGPRRYYDYGTWDIIDFIRINNAKLFLALLIFYITQSIFWIYALTATVKYFNRKKKMLE